jgi:hypothetical protein
MMEQILEKLNFTVFEFILKPERTMVFPAFKGNLFRGTLGKTLRGLTCAFRDRDCGECLIRDKCIYSQIFESHNTEDRSILKNIEKAPHPFIIDVPERHTLEYAAESQVRFFLTLIGEAVGYISYFVLAFEDIGKIGIGKPRVPFQVAAVRNFGNDVYDPAAKKISKDFRLLSGTDFEDEKKKRDSLTLAIESPLRLQFSGRLQKNITFEMLMRNLLRRIHLLSAFYCQGPDRVDFMDVIALARDVRTIAADLHWENQQRYSFRQEKEVAMGGIAGEITYQGDFRPFMKFLRLGEYLHLGKGTSFGLGRIRIKDQR